MLLLVVVTTGKLLYDWAWSFATGTYKSLWAVIILLGKKHTRLVIRFDASIALTIYHSLANSADEKLMIFFYYSHKTWFGISCKLSPLETICKKCQILFRGKSEKNITKCRLLNFLRSMQSVNCKHKSSLQWRVIRNCCRKNNVDPS